MPQYLKTTLALQALWAETIAKSEEDWSLIANERIDLYEKSLKDYVLQGVDLQEEEQSNPWTFVGSMFYCFTVLTTIGITQSRGFAPSRPRYTFG